MDLLIWPVSIKFIQSLLFWNVYERKEIAAVNKYLDRNLDLIEMGFFNWISKYVARKDFKRP